MKYAWLSEVTNAEAIRLTDLGVDEIYVTLGREGEVRALNLFKSYMDPRLTMAAHPTQRYTLRNRPIGILGRAEVWVKEWEPSPRDEDAWASDPGGLTFDEWVARQRA